MTKGLIGVLLLVAACGANAQEQNLAPRSSNAAAAFSETSGSQVQVVAVNADESFSANVARPEAPAPNADPAAPAANPKFVFGERDDYRWQLAVGFEFFRFQSSQFNANMLGVNTSLSYYTNGWFAVEGDVITGFSTTTYGVSSAHAKIFGGLGGLRIGSRRQKWEPWAHVLAGGAHLQPQTAAGGRGGLMALAGGGVDYRIHARLSFRLEGDWVYTNYFSQTQDSFQGVAGAVLHF